MQPITPCSFPKLRSNIPCADCYLISINNQHYFLLIYLYLMTMKTSYRKIYLFLLLLTSYSCNDLTETNMSIDIISMTKYNNIINIDSSETFMKVSEKDAFFFLLCRSSIIHFYFKTIFVFLNYLFPRSYPTEISKKEKSTDFFSQFP
jgi:hypothetical protein